MSILLCIENGDYNYWINSNTYYSMQNIEQFINYFFPDNLQINFIDNKDIKDNKNIKDKDTTNNTDTNKYNSKIYGIQLDDNTKLDNTKLNILICVENCNYHKHYKHYNKYGNFGNDKIQIYFYNHIDKCIITDKYIVIPVIYTQINYFLKYYKSYNNSINNYIINNIEPSIYTKFADKKFCLFASNNSFNSKNKDNIKSLLKSLGNCDTIDNYKHLISNKSCYHSIELLNLFNSYKFIFVCENSLGSGYITEKIFNCLFARCIPIYYGCNDIEKFIDKDCFINMNNINNINNMNNNDEYNENIIKNDILDLTNNETKFINKINANKIDNNYNDENYKDSLKIFIKKYV